MVKNTSGGKKAKGSARKFSNTTIKSKLIQSSNEYEMYAIVKKLLGDNRCKVLCHDNIERTCIIRGIFRGRNKKSNNVVVNGCVLVGLRDFEKKIMEEISDIKNCDLLEVYTDEEKEKLKSIELSINWKILSNEELTYGNKISDKDNTDDNFSFVNNYTIIEEDDENNEIKENVENIIDINDI